MSNADRLKAAADVLNSPVAFILPTKVREAIAGLIAAVGEQEARLYAVELAVDQLVSDKAVEIERLRRAVAALD